MGRNRTIIHILFYCLALSFSHGQGLDIKLNNYFNELKYDFETIASNANDLYYKKGKKKFIRQLKERDYVYSFLVTNSTGKVRNEVIRSVGPKYSSRSLARQPWFEPLKKSGKPYFTEFVKGNRKQLLWCFPVTSSPTSSKFEGVLVVKMDFVDCLKNFAQYMEDPFELDLKGNTFYSHQKFDSTEIKKKDIYIPGLTESVLMWQEGSKAYPESVYSQK